VSDFHPETRTYSRAGDEPQGTAQQAKAAAGEVAETAKDQARVVAQEARDQTRQLTHQLRRRTSEQAQQQSKRAADTVRQWTDELTTIGENVKPDSPVRGVVQQVAERGNRVADYLENEGLNGVVRDVQTFARRRPGLFLAGAVAAGFLVGRAAKAVAGADDSTGGSAPGYGGYGNRAGTAYGATGTSTYGTSTRSTPGTDTYGTGTYSTDTTYGTDTYGTTTGPTTGSTTGTTTGTAYAPGSTGYPAGDVSGTTTGYPAGHPAGYEDEATVDRRDDGLPGTPGTGGDLR
jgi:gas vesicle protein